MGVISVRLNEEEEKMLKRLMDYYGVDKSTLIKRSLYELYENILDLDFIEEFEKREKEGKTSFVTAEDILE
jgi:predicted DNA-binding protein